MTAKVNNIACNGYFLRNIFLDTSMSLPDMACRNRKCSTRWKKAISD